jgi:peptide deformylase
MALREIITYPHPILKAKAKPVERVDDTIRQLIDDMVETMYAAPGIGLAAPQVSQSLEICVVDVGVEDGKQGADLIVLVNPRILTATGSIRMREGCLSLPEFEEDMDRASNITVQAIGRDGKEFRLDAEGLRAVAIQHEMDHLKGVTLADRVSFLKRNLYLQKVKKGKVEKRPYNRPAL